MAYRAKIPEGTYRVYISQYLEEMSFGSYNNRSERKKKWGEPKLQWLLGFNILNPNEDGETVARPTSLSFQYCYYDLKPQAMINKVVANNKEALLFIEDPMTHLVGRFATVDFKSYWRLDTLKLIPKRDELQSERDAVKNIETTTQRIEHDKQQ